MYDCPQCETRLADNAVICNTCHWKPPNAAPDGLAAEAAAVRARYQARGATPWDLTEQQWYNVAKFFPKTAAKASQLSQRPLPDVCPGHPLDGTSQCGTLFAGTKLLRPAARMREPGED